MEENHSKDKIKRLAQNTLLYTISNFGTKIFTFLIVPLYTYYLSTSEYGAYDTINSLVGLIAPMCIFAINEALLRWLLKSDEKDSTVAQTGITLYLIFILLTDCFLIILFHFIPWKYSTLFILCLTTTSLFEVMQFTARGLKKNIPFAISGIIQTIIMLFLNVVFVIWFRDGIKGMLSSLAISQLLSSIYLYLAIKNILFENKYSFDIKLAKEMLFYSLLLVPNNISWWIMNSSDRIMLSSMIGSSFTGIYSIACKFPSLFTMMHTIFYRAWQEQAVTEYNSSDRDAYYTKIFNIYMCFGFCMVLLLIPISKIYIQFFMNSEFREAYKYIGILILGSLFCSFSSFYGTGYISAKDTKNATLTTFIGAFVNCVINLFFIKSIGIWAACISTLLGYVVTWIFRIKQTKKYFKINIKWNEFWLLLAISLIFSFLVTFNSLLITIFLLIISLIVSVFVNKDIVLIGLKWLKLKIMKK